MTVPAGVPVVHNARRKSSRLPDMPGALARRCEKNRMTYLDPQTTLGTIAFFDDYLTAIGAKHAIRFVRIGTRLAVVVESELRNL